MSCAHDGAHALDDGMAVVPTRGAPYKRALLILVLHAVSTVQDLFVGVRVAHSYSIYLAGLQMLDTVGLIFACMALRFSALHGSRACAQYTFGYDRMMVLAGFTLVMILIFTALLRIVSALQVAFGAGLLAAGKRNHVPDATLLHFVVSVIGTVMFFPMRHVRRLQKSSQREPTTRLVSGEPGAAPAGGIMTLPRFAFDDVTEGLFLHSAGDLLHATSHALLNWMAVNALQRTWVSALLSIVMALIMVMVTLPLLRRTSLTLMRENPPETRQVKERLAELREKMSFRVTDAQFWCTATGKTVGMLYIQIPSNGVEDEYVAYFHEVLGGLIGNLTVQVERDIS
ncbi:Zinc transporter 5 [Porphyridium purpureum]|uniref:Zinc transporter 5 n=1 Tax=Porphyridium purpureum TaxID=35688 RepID=A0A5J4Z1U7_PORPP|nr:Zinc transporter 5 [Porphyridium purpureum]|eukprot:POR3045..scf208_2